MYRKLTDQEVKNLGRDLLVNIDFVISHVGDGEYICNTFGGIYSSYWQAYKKALQKDNTLSFYMNIREDIPGDYVEYYIGNFVDENFNEPYARLTKETINPDFDLGH